MYNWYWWRGIGPYFTSSSQYLHQHHPCITDDVGDSPAMVPCQYSLFQRDTAKAARRRLSRHACHSCVFADPVIVEAAEWGRSLLVCLPDRLPLRLLSDDQIHRLVVRRRRRLTSAPSSSSPSCRANGTVPLTSGRHTNTALQGLRGGGGGGEGS